MLAGAAVPVIVCVACVVASGMGDGLAETLRQLRDYANQSTFNAMDVAKPVLVLAMLGFPLLILGGVFRRDRVPATHLPCDVVFVLLWLAAELAGVVAQRRMYAYHFLVLGPPSALCVGLVARRLRGRSLAMAFGPVVAMSLALAVGLWIDRSVDSRDDRVIAYLKAHAGGGEGVWTDDYPQLLVESDRRAGSSVPLIFLMANGDGAPAFFGRTLLNDWAARRPQYVAFFADPKRVADLYRYHMADVAESPKRADAIEYQLDAMQAFLAANYHAETDIDNVRIWRRGPTVADSIADTREAGR